VPRDLSRYQVPHDYSLGVAANDNEVEHLGMHVHLDAPRADRPGEGRVGAEEQLLARLAARVERARHLGAAEGAIREEPAVLTGKGNALRHALVDDVDRDLRQPVHVGLARAVVASLDGVVEEPMNAVAVVLVILGGVYAALGRDRVRAPRAVVEHEAAHPVAELRERGGGRSARKAGSDDDNLVLALVGRVDEADVGLVPAPLLAERPRRDP
jgi:hypothetical protein